MFSPDETLNSASAAPHCGDEWVKGYDTLVSAKGYDTKTFLWVQGYVIKTFVWVKGYVIKT